MDTTLPTAPITDRISYEDLYARWEKGNWRATEIDFSQDARDWQEKFDDIERTAALWNYSLFFWGEDAVADGLSPYIDAAPREEQKYFLATQQVDEARHAVFFARFMREVAGVARRRHRRHPPGDPAPAHLGLREDLRPARDDVRRAAPDRSRPQLAAAVTLYHVLIEATLAQPGQHFITSYLEERGIMPGFRAGMENVSADEQRHIGFGVKLLADLQREDPDCRYAVADLLREVIPWTAAVLVPPNWDERYVTLFGYTFEELGAEGALSLETKMRSAGLPLEELPGPPVFPAAATRSSARAAAGCSCRAASSARRSVRRPAIRSRSTSSSRRSPAGSTRPRALRARSSGTSPTSSRGTCTSRTATRARSPAGSSTRR